MLDFEFDETGKVVWDLKQILMFGSFCLGKKGGQKVEIYLHQELRPLF